MLWCFIGGIDTGEAFNFSSAGFFIEPLGITLFADFQRCVDENLNKLPVGHQLPDEIAVGLVRGDESRAGNETGIGKQFGHLSNSADVFGPVLRRKTKVLVEPHPDIVSVEEIGVFPYLMQLVVDRIGNGALATPA